MPAPRLLDKKLVNAELALDRKRQIDAGIKIAQKVDKVRDTLAEEENRLEDFRKNVLAQVQAQVTLKIAERDRLEESNKRLWRERQELLAPLDLQLARERERVEKEKREIADWNERLTQLSVEIVAKEAENEKLANILEKEKSEIERRDELSVQTLRAAELRFAEADDHLKKATEEVERVSNESKQRENHLKVREEDATAREVDLSKREKQVATALADIEGREKKLRSRQEMFIKAQNYLKAKKK